MSNSFASAASTAEIHVYEGPTYGVNVLLDVLQHALADDEARVLNMSWGIGEYIDGDGNIDEYHSVFNQMIGEGWSLVAAAGDGGATTGCERISVSYPGLRSRRNRGGRNVALHLPIQLWPGGRLDRRTLRLLQQRWRDRRRLQRLQLHQLSRWCGL